MVRFATVAAVLALMAAPLVAQESTEQLRKELESLRKEVDGLKSERAQYESKEVAGAAKVGQDSMSPDGDSPVMTLLKETKLSGFVDASYMVTFNAPNTPGTLPARVFDTNPNSFYLNAVQLNLERLATEKMIVGYHLELAAGHDAFVYDGQTVSLQEGWAQILAPVGAGLDIRIGKMATLAGYEVLEAKDDMNISRGVLFGFAIPFTHTGIRAAYALSDMLSVTVGASNGWNTASAPGNVSTTYQDRDYGKTLELQMAVKPTKDSFVNLTIYVGDESTANASNGPRYSKRYVVDVVGGITMDKLTLAMEIDFGSQQDVGIVGESAPWSGAAIFAKYAITDTLAGAIRLEYYSDTDGGNGGFGNGEGGAGARIVDVTVTVETKIASQMILRFEIRSDNSNDHIFFRGGTAAKGQTTLGAQVIMPF